MMMNRSDCIFYMKKNEFPIPVKSACVFCPYHSDWMWKEMKKENRKDMRNEVSDYNQSQMIEQRKNRRQPLDNPKGGPAI